MNGFDSNFDAAAFSNALADAADKASRSVVTVWAARGRPISGVVVGEGEVLTVGHVLEGEGATVQLGNQLGNGQLGGDRFKASVAGRDVGSDLALLRVEGLRAPAIAAGTARLGSFVLAVARPGGSPMVSGGVVSGENVPRPFRGQFRGQGRGGWLRTDATPYPGFSGSALVNVGGELVGVVNAGVSRGELLALPAARALEVARALRERGTSPRGFLGVRIQEVPLPDGTPGLLVMNVENASPAQEAGMLLGDLLLTWNGEPLETGAALTEHIGGGAGQTVTLGAQRGGQPLTLSVTLGARER